MFLFSVKAGDLNRSEWNGGRVQDLRPSLEEMLDDYIPNRIPSEYRKLKVVIVIVVGGVIRQEVAPLVESFKRRQTTRKISFQEWNGDKIAELLLAGLLREKVLPKPLQSSFRKAVAMVDTPDVAYDHFARLLVAFKGWIKTDADRVRVGRQVYICLWVVFVWARDADNLDAPYRASELALLNLWELTKPFVNKRGARAKAMSASLAPH